MVYFAYFAAGIICGIIVLAVAACCYVEGSLEEKVERWIDGDD